MTVLGVMLFSAMSLVGVVFNVPVLAATDDESRQLYEWCVDNTDTDGLSPSEANDAVVACASERINDYDNKISACGNNPSQDAINACLQNVRSEFSITAPPQAPDFTATPVCTGDQTPETDNCVDTSTKCRPDANGVVKPGVPLSVPDDPNTPENESCLELDQSKVVPLEENPIIIYAGRILVVISAGIGIILVMVTIIAGFRYILAKGNPQETAAAKNMIEKVAISAVMYMFAFALINWLIPGGLLN